MRLHQSPGGIRLVAESTGPLFCWYIFGRMIGLEMGPIDLQCGEHFLTSIPVLTTMLTVDGWTVIMTLQMLCQPSFRTEEFLALDTLMFAGLAVDFHMLYKPLVSFTDGLAEGTLSIISSNGRQLNLPWFLN